MSKVKEIVWEHSILPKGYRYHTREYRNLDAAKREQDRLKKHGFETKRVRGRKLDIAIAIKNNPNKEAEP